MHSTGLAPSKPTFAPSARPNYLLLAGGYFSLAFAVFQVSAIWWPQSAFGYFGGPAQMSIDRPIAFAALCLAVGAMAAVFGLYALSGAGTIRRLPLLRTILIGIAASYLLRGLSVIAEMPLVLKHPELVRFLGFSVISLCVGLVHAGGVLQLYRRGRPGEAR